MTIRVWNVKAGKVISFLYDSGKEKKILSLKCPIEIDNKKIIDEIDSAIGVVVRYVVGISDYKESSCDRSVDREILNVNNENIMEGTIDTPQDEILGGVITRFIQEPDKRYQGWIGTMSELYEQLYMRLGDLGITYTRKQFPKSPIALARRIDAIAANLKAVGIVVERFRDRRDKIVNDGKVERLVQIAYVGREELISKEDSGIKKDDDIIINICQHCKMRNKSILIISKIFVEGE